MKTKKKIGILRFALCLCIVAAFVFACVSVYALDADGEEATPVMSAPKADAADANTEQQTDSSEQPSVATETDGMISEEEVALSPKVSSELTEQIKNSDADALIEVYIELVSVDEETKEQAVFDRTGILCDDYGPIAPEEQKEAYWTARREIIGSLYRSRNESLLVSFFGASSLDDLNSDRIVFVGSYFPLTVVKLTADEILRLSTFAEVRSLDVGEEVAWTDFLEP